MVEEVEKQVEEALGKIEQKHQFIELRAKGWRRKKPG